MSHPEHKIGVLLPQSNAHPLMGKSFLNGLKLATAPNNLKFMVESIGFGENPKQLIDSTQKLIHQEEVILTTGLLGDYGLPELIDFVSKNEEILITATLGAGKPIELPNGVVHNSLGLYDSIQQLTSYFAKNNIKNIATSSCYYEAGYGFNEALFQAYKAQENTIDITGHFITPLNPRENESELMEVAFSDINPDAIIAYHNGIYAKEHAEFLTQNKIYNKYPIYALPFSTETSTIKEFPEVINNIKTISSWQPELDNTVNKAFVEAFTNKYGKQPDYFALLGYENGLIINEFLIKKESNPKTHIHEIQTEGPRGTINFNNSYKKTNYDCYIWDHKFVDESNIQKNNNITLPNTFFKGTEIQSHQGWFNAYLCH